MSAVIDLMELMPRIRKGDHAAQQAFYLEFEEQMRREVRLRVRFDSHFRRLFESVDIYQEVMKSFFLRTQKGEYELEQPAQIYALLKTMVRHKVSKKRRWLSADQRQEYQQKNISPESWQLLASRRDVNQQVLENQEALQGILSKLNDDERRMAELQLAGHSWKEIAEQCGGTANSCRMKLTRAWMGVLANTEN